MKNNIIHSVLSFNEVQNLVNDSLVKLNKEKLSDEHRVVKFYMPMSDDIKSKLENSLSINLSQITMIPMRWIRGDTVPHIDKGDTSFTTTYLLYLTDSIGSLLIDGQSYPIAVGDAHIFSEGLEHSTINTGNNERLMLGPMSESGFGVGAPTSILYFNNETDASNNENSIVSDWTNYTIETINDISSWMIFSNYYGSNPTPNGGPHYTGEDLIPSGTYYLYPYITQPQPQLFRLSMNSLFTNNAQVYYKPHSLSTGSGGSGVTNARHKQRRT
ncbi:unannotated protein [freshwater metagenome]|uniref:Unannotated protein n=1 Tax=freshwater metagenome TaxID=449393 RepID=A0A6J7IY06_9ZZZZ|nr:hypothetical protein [Actinomycetota bacterium]